MQTLVEELVGALDAIGADPAAQLAYLHDRGVRAEETRYASEEESQKATAYALEGDYEADARGQYPAKLRLIRLVARTALDRYRADPGVLLREAGQARREEGERVRDGK